MEPNLIDASREVIQNLIRLAAERSRAEIAFEKGLASRNEGLEKEVQAGRQRATAAFESEKTRIESEFQEVRRKLVSQFETDYRSAEMEFAEKKRAVTNQFEEENEKTEKKYKETSWTVSTVIEADRTRFDERIKEIQAKTTEAAQEAKTIQEEAIALLDKWNQDTAFEKTAKEPKKLDDEQSLVQIKELVIEARECLDSLKTLTLPRYLVGERILWLFFLFWLVEMGALAGLLYWMLTEEMIEAAANGWPKGWYFWIGGGTAITLIVTVVVRFWIGAKVDKQVDERYLPLRHALVEMREQARRCLQEFIPNYTRLKAESKQKHEKELRQLNDYYAKKKEVVKQKHEQDLRQLEEKYPRLLAEMKKKHEQNLRQIEEKYPRLLAETKKKFEVESQQVQQKYQLVAGEIQKRRDAEWSALASGWWQGLARVRKLVEEIGRENDRLFPDWTSTSWDAWKPPAAVPPGIRFGEVLVELAEMPDGVPRDDRLKPQTPFLFELPVLLPFPNRCSLLIRVSDDSREMAVQLLQAVMLRFLTGMPPSKVRLTIIDPVGLGENFASFMHLADFEESLVNTRIWTEPQQIEHRLTDLTEHMETVIQKYLRNQFTSIAEYNAQAGEVAEPYRVLVIANFPANFSEAAAKRLTSIAASGAGCGVYTLVSVDTKQPLPSGFSLKELEQNSISLTWKDDCFAWKDEVLAEYPLHLEVPPDAEACTRILHAVGEKAKAAVRVEVPFEIIAPAADKWWSLDSRQGIRIPLGRAGATKLQYLQLGLGTSQHVLIAGKTGSGKSTLMHALITNLALYYSPEEVEFCLIDFKKGVEFKVYATQGLPHARVVAIESEREFGLSVLQRLDVELRERGEMFRAAGAQDVNSYRRITNGKPLPRLMLIVDEFQEFFIEDDKIAQDTSLLLDRLVRQGRAFGIHVLLGSQTLGGAYSLARSTLGQMAIRIALQCSEADANLILSEENTAARLLSRPGEAIYNDANGMSEGNDFFQVVWLSDERREDYLKRIRELAVREKKIPSRPTIVFEGNAPAEVSKNHLLLRLLSARRAGGQPSAAQKSFQAWLGEAIAIKDPTAATFRPQGGTNLLMVGQQDDAALAILTMSIIGLSAQLPSGGNSTRFYVLDGSPVDDRNFGYLARVVEMLPQPAKAGTFKDLAPLLSEVSAEILRRQTDGAGDSLPVFVVIHGIQRFRELRKQDDDFGFSRGDDKPASPSEMLVTILREGPPLGVYVMVWCDSLNNVQRALDRQGLREFELRVLMQMSAADSSTLIDSPVAGKLGTNRALYFTEELGQPEKFRPYALPSPQWLAQVKVSLQGNRAKAPA